MSEDPPAPPPGDDDWTLADDDRTLDATEAPRGAGGPLEIGGYSVLGKLGEGGMGVVYEAEQEHPKRRVALKVVRGGQFVDDLRVRMFEREADTLARLRHPNIGAIYESGRTDDGQHFFAMELVRGDTLDVYLAQRDEAITVEELEHRLRLFREICDAVHYAHQRGVIHRDLKPSNIIVTPEADRQLSGSAPSAPAIKILDFGLARITDADVAAASVLTEVGVIKGTLRYMSPEQATGRSDEIDTRSDVYALGLLLYEMITNTRPYDLGEAALAEAIRVICEEPPKPLRQTWSGVRRLDDDIETIVGKALEKEADRRYSSAAAVSEDVQRYLDSQPILARPPSAVYQLKKLFVRNRVVVSAAAVALASLVLATIVSTAMFLRAERQADIARTEARKSSQVSGFLSEMIEGVGPSVARGRDTTMLREVLDRTAERVGDELADQPAVEATLRRTLGITYWELGEYDDANTNMQRTLELHDQFEVEGLDRGGLILDLANLRWAQGELERAAELMREAKALFVERHQPPHVDLAQADRDLGNVLVALGRYDEAQPLLTSALEMYRGLDDDHRESIATCLNSLGNLARYLGDGETAEGRYVEALALHREALGDDHPFVSVDLHNLGGLYGELQRWNDAERTLGEALDLATTLHDGPHPQVASAYLALSGLALRRQQLDRAEDLAQQALQVYSDVHGEEHADFARALDELARIEGERGNHAAAGAYSERILEIYRNSFEAPHPRIATGLNNLAFNLQQRGLFEQALPHFQEALGMHLELYGAEHPQSLLVKNNIARVLSSLQRDDEAAAAFEEVLETRRRVLGADNPSVAVTAVDLSSIRRRQGRLDDAEHLLRQARDTYAAAMGEDHPGTWIVTTRLGDVLRESGALSEAEGLLRESADRLAAAYSPNNGRVVSARASLAAVLLLQGKQDDAQRWFARSLDESQGQVAPLDRSRVLRFRGEAWQELGDLAKAERDLLRSHATVVAAFDGDHSTAKLVAQKLAELYEEWGRADEAARWQARGG